jgi:sporulation protein YlmC with PRC-barrel domain
MVAAQDVAVETRTDASGREVYHASDVIGMEVYDESKDQIGKVEDLVIDAQTGEVLYTVLSFSGIKEIGDKWVVLPWNAVEPHADYIMIGVPVATIVEAPAFTRTEFRQANFTQVRTRVDRFFADVDINIRDRGNRRDRDGDRGRSNTRINNDVDVNVRDRNRNDRDGDDRNTTNRRDGETREGRSTERKTERKSNDRNADDRNTKDRNDANREQPERGTTTPRLNPRSGNRDNDAPAAGNRDQKSNNRDAPRTEQPRTPRVPDANRGTGNAPTPKGAAPKSNAPRNPAGPGAGNQ